MNIETKAAAKRRQAAAVLRQISPMNYGLACEVLDQMERNVLKAATVLRMACTVRDLDRAFHAPMAKVQPAEIRAFLDDHARTHAVATTRLLAVMTGQVVAHVLGVRTEDLPRVWKDAVQAKRPNQTLHGAVIERTDFLAALEAVDSLSRPQSITSWRELAKALLWTLYEGGFRISEAQALRKCDLVFQADGRTADLHLRNDQETVREEGLKTGGRSVVLMEAVPALRVWIALHPYSDPEAPLFPAFAYHRVPRPMSDDSSNDLIKEVFSAVGAKPRGKRKNFTNHDFRHTAATNDARRGWKEADLRLKYGWGPSSPMPALYVKLNLEDQRQRVLATYTTAPAAPPGWPIVTTETLAAALRNLMGQAATSTVPSVDP